MNALILGGGALVLLTVLWAANILVQRPRRFTDNDVDGAPDATPAEIAKVQENDAWNKPENALDLDAD